MVLYSDCKNVDIEEAKLKLPAPYMPLPILN